MPGFDERRRMAMQRLPPLPRALFLLHNFYGVDVGAMADKLGAGSDTIAACLAEARAMIHAHVCFTEPAIGSAAPVVDMAAQLQRDYRQSLETTFAESGYPGEILWSASPADIPADEAAAASFIIALLPAGLRRAVARSQRSDITAAELWRFAKPWRRCQRGRLLRVTEALHCAGWQPFDEWLSERLIPNRRYPHGYPEYHRRRRPLPEERPLTQAEKNGEEVVDTVQIPLRLVDQPELTRRVWILFHYYGRPVDEIAQRLCIGRADVKRRRERGDYAIRGRPYPSLAHRIRFELMVKWASLGHRWEIIRSALYG